MYTLQIDMCANCLSLPSLNSSQVMLGTKFNIQFWLPALDQEQGIYNQQRALPAERERERVEDCYNNKVLHMFLISDFIMQSDDIVNNIFMYIHNFSFYNLYDRLRPRNTHHLFIISKPHFREGVVIKTGRLSTKLLTSYYNFKLIAARRYFSSCRA